MKPPLDGVVDSVPRSFHGKQGRHRVVAGVPFNQFNKHTIGSIEDDSVGGAIVVRACHHVNEGLGKSHSDVELRSFGFDDDRPEMLVHHQEIDSSSDNRACFIRCGIIRKLDFDGFFGIQIEGEARKVGSR